MSHREDAVNAGAEAQASEDEEFLDGGYLDDSERILTAAYSGIRLHVLREELERAHEDAWEESDGRTRIAKWHHVEHLRARVAELEGQKQ